MVRKSVNSFSLSAAGLVKNAVFKQLLHIHKYQRVQQYQEVRKERQTLSHLPVGLIVKTVVISRISPDR